MCSNKFDVASWWNGKYHMSPEAFHKLVDLLRSNRKIHQWRLNRTYLSWDCSWDWCEIHWWNASAWRCADTFLMLFFLAITLPLTFPGLKTNCKEVESVNCRRIIQRCCWSDWRLALLHQHRRSLPWVPSLPLCIAPWPCHGNPEHCVNLWVVAVLTLVEDREFVGFDSLLGGTCFFSFMNWVD